MKNYTTDISLNTLAKIEELIIKKELDYFIVPYCLSIYYRHIIALLVL